MADFLLEIGCEEIPARMVEGATKHFATRVAGVLERERLGGAAKVNAFATPRRLAVLVAGIAASQADAEEQVMGPATKIAYKDGQPTAAAQAFAKKVGVEVQKLEKVTNAKGEYLAATIKQKDSRQQRFWPGRCRKKSRRFIGRRACTGVKASQSDLCARCAGSWRCSMVKWFRLNSRE